VILVSTLTLVVVGSMLFIFYGQYRWLANSIVSSSVDQHYVSLSQSFERQARGELHRIAESLAELGIEDYGGQVLVLNNAIATSTNLIGLRFVQADGTNVQSGEEVEDPGDQSFSWHENMLTMSHPVRNNGAVLGNLLSSFSLTTLSRELQEFEDRLIQQGTQRRQDSLFWIGGATLVTLGLCGLVIWLIVKAQALRIRELKVQAQKLSESDFGEPLQVLHGDELGDLAEVFNNMRDKLRSTTISRDYVDSILSSMNEAIIVTSADGTISRINKATSRLLGYSFEELEGQGIDVIIDRNKGRPLEADTSAGVPRDAFLLSKTGERIPVSYTSSTTVNEDGEAGDCIYAAQNITERRKAEQRIRYLARIDALTKIPNRMQFQHLLQRAIARARRSGKSLALLYLDVDKFKDINDTFGHLAGDKTLETVASRLKSASPPNSVIGRLAGDEFAVIVDNLEPGPKVRSDLNELARKILDDLAEPFFVKENEVFMTGSMGIAYYPSDARNVIDLIRNADAALYHSKKNGGNVFSYYKAEMNEAAVERLMTKSKLKRAFERNELLVHYQPKYNLETGLVTGAEALVRWELPDRGIVMPSDFIPIAEESSLIIEIGEWVLDRVCEDFREWQQAINPVHRVSVNLSLKQLRQPNFIRRMMSVLKHYQVSPSSLELEITETTLMENPERTIKLLDELYSLGLYLAIDDFGTGYSSLSALQQFPISTLKIDKSFVRDVSTSADDATIVGTIIHMGKSLGMDVVAEGVETEEQLTFLQRMNCTYVQGLLFGDPMSSDNYLELLLSQSEGTDAHRALFA
jgi:diguanylate cyclase (GGDEF)-like protein/PAS domain S-box-containing protein